MCGRYALFTPFEKLRRLLNLESGFPLPPHYNLAPTQPMPVICRDGRGKRRLGLMRWGLVPVWAKKMPADKPLINARAETIGELPSFKQNFRRHRCLAPADGFYEWRNKGGVKQPMFIHLRDRRPFVFAAIWDRWHGEDGGDELLSFAIVTRPALPKLAAIHPRMPLILRPEAINAWLAPEAPPEPMDPALLPNEDQFDFHPVSTLVNRIANDDASLIAPTAPKLQQPGLF